MTSSDLGSPRENKKKARHLTFPQIALLVLASIWVGRMSANNATTLQTERSKATTAASKNHNTNIQAKRSRAKTTSASASLRTKRSQDTRTIITTPPAPSLSNNQLIPQDVLDRHSQTMQQAKSYLEHGGGICRRNWACIYKDVIVSLPLRSSNLYYRFVGQVGEVKGMLHPRVAFPNKDDCIVYGMGISHDSSFEEKMSSFCNNVHAFDCTVDVNAEAVKDKPFTFHQVCIGSPTEIDEVDRYGNNNRTLVFKPLTQVMTDLKHDQIDMLKFDIEGSEWELLYKELIDVKRANPSFRLPKQLLFELHAEGANPNYVPPKTVAGKTHQEVNQVFLDLYNLGYRVIEKEPNIGDPMCSEFSLVLVE